MGSHTPRRRGLRAIAALAVLATTIGIWAPWASAVHDETFQLDGDVLASTQTNVGGKVQALDWSSLFTSVGASQNPLPTGFGAATFVKDFNTNANGSYNTSDATTYATGSKDILPISGWQCNRDNNVNNKIDISNGYAATYKSPTGDDILYFGLERAYNGGDANVGFWFFQDAVGCTSPGGGSTDFTGAHQDGDLLIVSAFTKGGSVSGVDVYRWNGSSPGSLGTTPVFQGGSDCKNTGALDTACATVNSLDNGPLGVITTPWQTHSEKLGIGTSLPIASMFEGGLNLTKANLGGRCFNSFQGDTRSSQSLTATLFDYTGGTIGECTSTTETTPLQGSGAAIPAGGLTIPADPANAALSVKDSALITVHGVNSFVGSVDFHLCGPTATNSTATCTTGGVALGSKSITSNGTVESDPATVTSAGRYCFRADFSASSPSGIPPSSDSRASECFVVNPIKASLTTQAGSGPVDFGQPITDTATLTNTAHKPGTGGPAGSNGSINPATLGGDATGNITFNAYDNPTCSGTPVYTTTVAVSGNGTYGPVSFTPTAPGTYHWVASYPGDSPNTLAADTGACDDANEDVVVRQIPTTIKTRQSWTPNDTVTIASSVGNLGLNGSVTFELFSNATCSGSDVFHQTVAIGGGSPSATVSTTNTTFVITTGFADPANSTVGPYSWRVTYTPNVLDVAHTGRRSTCDAEHFDIDYTNDPGNGVLFP